MLKIGNYEFETPAICASVIGDTVDVMMARLDKAIGQGADVVELRLDRLQDQAEWSELNQDKIPTIITNRTIREGGSFKGSESDRIGVLLEAVDEKVACIDIEFSTSRKYLDKVIDAVEDSETSLILSFHTHDKIPPVNELIETAESMQDLGCDMAKLIGYADHFTDGINILDFMLEAYDHIDIPVIAFAMGEEGKFTRLVSHLFGSPITYASIDEATAPGQINVVEMKRFLELMNSKD